MCCAVYHASVEARVTTNLTTSHLAYVISSGRRFAVLLFLSHIMQLYLSLFAVFHVHVLEPRICLDGFWCQTEIVWLCCGTDVKQEGLFRKAGNVDRQRVLCDRLDSAEAQLLLHEFTVHDCATVLKTFLGEMPEPLLVEKYCTAYRQVAGLLDSNATCVICVFIV